MKVIECNNVSKDFPSNVTFTQFRRVLDNITFSLDSGESVAFIGPNGCGKTTLLKTLATIYQPDEGEIRIFGHDVVENRSRVRAACAFVSPALSFQNKLTLRKTIRFFAGCLGLPPDSAYTFLKRMNIIHLLDKRLEGFSEGQKAMVRLAIGLLKEPRILILDEVVATLDINRREAVIGFIEEEVERNDLTLDYWRQNVDRLLAFNERPILQNAGSISAEKMKEIAHERYETFDANRRGVVDGRVSARHGYQCKAYENSKRG